jgi:6,7-dimethyl-8-ribityllumazine synthase
MQNKRQPASFSFEAEPHILIIEARHYSDIADLQLQGAKQILEKAGASYEVIAVPGALEIPATIGFILKAMAFDPERKRPDGYLALGCVIKGGTTHDEIVGRESAHALQQLALTRVLAIGNGILTCNTKEQALERADPARLDRGGEAAETCLRMVEIKHQLRLSSHRRWTS